MTLIRSADIHKLVVACDAGMGSSVMLAGQLRKQLKKYPVTVLHSPVSEIPADADVVLCHTGLSARARAAAAPTTVVVAFQVFLGDPAVTRIVKLIQDGGEVDV